jgi:hypothetical protein
MLPSLGPLAMIMHLMHLGRMSEKKHLPSCRYGLNVLSIQRIVRLSRSIITFCEHG